MISAATRTLKSPSCAAQWVRQAAGTTAASSLRAVGSQQLRMNSAAVGTAEETASAIPASFHHQVFDEQYDAKGEYARQTLLQAAAATRPRNDWTRKQVSVIYHQPLLELAYQAVSRGSTTPLGIRHVTVPD